MAERTTLCLNPTNQALTQFTSFNFNSYARVGDGFFGANETGLYLMGGADDAGADIDAYFLLKTTDFGAYETKRFIRAYVGGDADGHFALSLSANEDAFTDYDVVLDPTFNGYQYEAFVNLDGRVRGRYWQAKISNTDGSDFSIDSITLLGAGKQRYNLFSGSTGLSARIDPVRVPYDPETGVNGLVQAVNVWVDDSGRTGRREGYTLKSAGYFHSLFCNKSHGLVVQEHPTMAALYRVSENGALTGIRSSITKFQPMSYHALNGLIYYSNGIETGVYVEEAGTSTAWTKGEQVGLSMDREISDPPPARHITSLGINMILSDSNLRSTLWASGEMSFTNFNLDDGHVDVSSPVTMLKAVRDGVWVGTETETLFLAGTTPDEWVVARRVPYGVREFSASHEAVPASRLSPDAQGEGFFWLSANGVCWGGPSGQLMELGHKAIDPRQIRSTRGACLVTEDMVIITME